MAQLKAGEIDGILGSREQRVQRDERAERPPVNSTLEGRWQCITSSSFVARPWHDLLCRLFFSFLYGHPPDWDLRLLPAGSRLALTLSPHPPSTTNASANPITTLSGGHEGSRRGRTGVRRGIESLRRRLQGISRGANGLGAPSQGGPVRQRRHQRHGYPCG